MTTLRRHSERFDSSSVKYLVTRGVLSIQINPLDKPKLVMIPAKSVVELKGTSSIAGLTALIWEHRAHMIFEADLPRLNPDPNRSV